MAFRRRIGVRVLVAMEARGGLTAATGLGRDIGERHARLGPLDRRGIAVDQLPRVVRAAARPVQVVIPVQVQTAVQVGETLEKPSSQAQKPAHLNS